MPVCTCLHAYVIVPFLPAAFDKNQDKASARSLEKMREVGRKGRSSSPAEPPASAPFPLSPGNPPPPSALLLILALSGKHPPPALLHRGSTVFPWLLRTQARRGSGNQDNHLSPFPLVRDRPAVPHLRLCARAVPVTRCLSRPPPACLSPSQVAEPEGGARSEGGLPTASPWEPPATASLAKFLLL